MFSFSNTPLGRFRLIAILEGFSYLFLVFICMPIKYMAHIPEPVKYMGWLHGVLFVAFCATLLHVWIDRKWSFLKTVLAFVSSLLPFGTFVLDRSLRKEDSAVTVRA